ncbi:hypothetical protein [Negadavirga shengliensis]|uniref:Uncharacterized protein n=1 Tax=Negadavirga shengliensis TaxID=1389218 RepID=A0ABV9T535_9BACT
MCRDWSWRFHIDGIYGFLSDFKRPAFGKASFFRKGKMWLDWPNKKSRSLAEVDPTLADFKNKSFIDNIYNQGISYK